VWADAHELEVEVEVEVEVEDLKASLSGSSKPPEHGSMFNTFLLPLYRYP